MSRSAWTRLAPGRLRSRAALAILALAISGAPARAQSEPLLIDRGADRVTIRLVPEPRAAVGGTGNELTVGDPFWVTVRTEGPPGYRLLPQSLIDAFGPHPELAVIGSERRDGLLRLQIALFRPGDVILPSVSAGVVTDRGDTLTVPVRADTMRVASVLAPGDTVLADIKPLWRPKGIPTWVWWLLAAAVALAAFLIWRWWRRRPAPAVPLREARDAYLEARQRITALGAEPADPEAAIAAAAGIGDALRDYLTEAWSYPARERTTLELLPTLPPAAAAERAALGGALAMADLAKFARLAPGQGEVPRLASRALAILDRLEDARVQSAAAASPEAATAGSTGAREAAS
jgi:hypothetical protein